MLGVYIHIPFCIKKCNYCSFCSYEGALQYEELYVERVIKEIKSYEKDKIDTVYFGGGTPSLLKSESLLKILLTVYEQFEVSKNAEITLEANPKTADREKFKRLFEGGFNRISFGFQSFKDSELEALGRVHKSCDNEKAFLDAREAGFKNISADIMFALPNQSLKDFEENIDKMLSLSPEHFSAYSLSIDEGTFFFEMADTLSLPGEDLEREMYYLLCEKLKSAGYEHYEISNFAKEGMRARHNTKYWLGEPYIGIGAGAHSYYKDKRYANICDIKEYIQKENVTEFCEYIDEDEKNREQYMLQLRMSDGIEKEENPKIDALIEKGLLEEVNGRIRLTKRGIDISNYVFSELM